MQYCTEHLSEGSPRLQGDLVRRAKTQVLTLCFLLVMVLAAGCGRPSLDLSIYFTCDTHGRLEPCGCFAGQLGGLTRLKTALDSEAPADALRLDVGDAIAGREDHDIIQYGYMLRAFAIMKYDALNIGHREARLPVSRLLEIKRTSPVPILSANLLDKTSRKTVFDPYRILQRGGFRIAIIGVVDPRGLEQDLGEGLVLDDMQSALIRYLAEVREKSDFIVLLAFADEATLAKLARQFYEPHLILGGKVSQPAQELRKENRSLVYYVTNESRAFGTLSLRLAEGSAPEALGNGVRLLHDQISQDKAVIELARAYRDEVRHARLAVDDPNSPSSDLIPGVRIAAMYVGIEKCMECHPSASAIWKGSAHSSAFVSLLDRKADADPKCLGCHTVGFGHPSGYRREFGATKLVHVGCESCHGPGSLHVRQQEGDNSISFNYRPLDAGDCKQCHYGEFSRPFVWKEFWPQIKHGKEERPAGIH